MWYFGPQACGINISIAWHKSLPLATSSSNILSRQAESLCPSFIKGNISFKSSPKRDEENCACLPSKLFKLPFNVLISPL